MKAFVILAVGIGVIAAPGCTTQKAAEPSPEAAKVSTTAHPNAPASSTDGAMPGALPRGASAPECQSSDHRNPGDACAAPANGPGSTTGAETSPPAHASRSDTTPSSSQDGESATQKPEPR